MRLLAAFSIPLEPDTLARILYGCFGIGLGFSPFFSTTSIGAQLVKAHLETAPIGFLTGWLLVASLTPLGAMIVLDAFINEAMPEVNWHWASKMRHVILCWAAFDCASALMAAILQDYGEWGKITGPVIYSTMVVFGPVIAVRDAMRRPGHLLCDT